MDPGPAHATKLLDCPKASVSHAGQGAGDMGVYETDRKHLGSGAASWIDYVLTSISSYRLV